MAFFDTFTNKSKEVAEKAKKMAEVASLNSKISAKESEIKKVHSEIGKLICENKEAWTTVDLSELFAKVETFQAEIEKLKAEILMIKEVKICAQCGGEIEKTAAFCPKCGAAAPVVEEVAEEVVAEAEEVVAEVVTEAAEEVAAEVVEEQPVSDEGVTQ